MKLNGLDFYRMTLSGAACLAKNEKAVNDMNVFPVPDGDTGSNMTSTLSTVSTLGECEYTLSDYAAKIASLVLRAARGNSGAILSLFFRGMAKAFEGEREADASRFAVALDCGVKEAYRAVATPKEGTVLTVMRRTAEAALAVSRDYGDDLCGFVAHLVTVADGELARTPELLPILREAKVVDAGGYGFLLLLTGMLAYLRGEAVSFKTTAVLPKGADFSAFREEDLTFTYCTECIIEKSQAASGDGSAEAFRETLLTLGDSLVFLDDEVVVKLHIHTDRPDEVLRGALALGSLFSVKIENMRLQHSEKVIEKEAAAMKTPDRPYSFVSVCMGEGVAEVFREMGVDSTVRGGQTMNPSTEELVSALEASGGEVVYLFPNNKNILLVANEAAALTHDRRVVVVPTRNIAEGIASLLAFDEAATVEDNFSAMEEARGRVSCISITHAVRDCEIGGLPVRKDQVIGLVDDTLAAAGLSAEDCLVALADRFIGAVSVTVFCGEEVGERERARMEGLFRSLLADDAELLMLDGGQSVYEYVISIE